MQPAKCLGTPRHAPLFFFSVGGDPTRIAQRHSEILIGNGLASAATIDWPGLSRGSQYPYRTPLQLQQRSQCQCVYSKAGGLSRFAPPHVPLPCHCVDYRPPAYPAVYNIIITSRRRGNGRRLICCCLVCLLVCLARLSASALLFSTPSFSYRSSREHILICKLSAPFNATCMDNSRDLLTHI